MTEKLLENVFKNQNCCCFLKLLKNSKVQTKDLHSDMATVFQRKIKF